ncbi:DUF4402 domain-containing protein [Halomonas sp.]
MTWPTTTELQTGTGIAGEIMTLTLISEFTPGTATSGMVTNGLLSNAGTQSIYLGGTLDVAVAGTQILGAYTGNVPVTVEYN